MPSTSDLDDFDRTPGKRVPTSILPPKGAVGGAMRQGHESGDRACWPASPARSAAEWVIDHTRAGGERLTKADVLNTLSPEQFLQALRPKPGSAKVKQAGRSR